MKARHWIVELLIEWPKFRFRRLRHRHKGHKKGEVTFRKVREDHAIHVTFERNHPVHGG